MHRRLLALIALLFSCDAVYGDVIYSFVNTGAFDGDGASATAVLPADSVTGIVPTLTTTNVTGGVLNENKDRLGIGSGSAFDVGESWTFRFDVGARFSTINFNALTNNEEFEISSAAWTSQSFDTSGVPNLTFEMASGTFSFTDDNTDDLFDLGAITGGDLFVPAGTTITFEAVSGSAAVQSLVFSAVPEPSAVALIPLFGCLFVRFRGKRS